MNVRFGQMELSIASGLRLFTRMLRSLSFAAEVLTNERIAALAVE